MPSLEARRIPTLHNAIEAGAPVDVSVSGIAADALGAPRIGQVAFEVATRTRPVSVLVEDEAIDAARDQLWDSYRIPREHGAAAAFAALTAGAYEPAAGETVAVIVCGANTDLRTLGASAVSRS
jgi:threonine dehydratase